MVQCGHSDMFWVSRGMAVRKALCLLCLVVPCSAQRLIDDEALKTFNFTAKSSLRSKYRPIYHITSPMGWLNKPSGFVKFRNQYHVFYLHYPYSGAWGHTGWGNAVSDSLVYWIRYPPALVPKENYEKHGCLGGSALIHNDYLTLFYTGNVIEKNSQTIQTQNVAISSDGVVFQKYLYNPIQKSPFNDIGDFRNPKVWRFRNSFYMLVGGMSPKRMGQLLLYTSADMFHWKLNGTLAESYGDMGYLWENPDFFELDGMNVLMFCARGVQTDGYRFRNLYQAGYVVGTFDYHKRRFENYFEVSTATFNTIDHGHDFYAPQTMIDTDGRRLLIAWLGMWESNFQESNEGWASMMTTVRELSLTPEGKLLMIPARELTELRTEVLEEALYSPGEWFTAGCKSFELLANSNMHVNHAKIVFDWDDDNKFIIEYDSSSGYVSIDRGGEDGVRKASWAPVDDMVRWRIFFDFSAIEVFCGMGEVVFSSRIYPLGVMNIKVAGDTQFHMLQYRLRRGVAHDDMNPAVGVINMRYHGTHFD